ncbi:Derlin 1 [Dissophora globulifera]|nr:Derlin 1 [Dissophora globulifera]
MAENELLAAYKSVPIVTRSLLTATVVLSVSAAMQLLSPYLIMLDWPSIIYKFQIHRLLTSCFLTGLGFNMLFDLYFLFTYGVQLESTTYAGRSADFAWFIIFTSFTSAGAGYYFGFRTLFQSMLLAVIYLWSQANSQRIVSFMFGIQFKVLGNRPYNFLLSGAVVPWNMLAGIASAHLYYFLESVYPARGGRRWIPTPFLLYKLLPPQEVAGAGFAAGGGTANVLRPTATTAAAEAAGHRWGRGERLG